MRSELEPPSSEPFFEMLFPAEAGRLEAGWSEGGRSEVGQVKAEWAPQNRSKSDVVAKTASANLSVTSRLSG